MADKQVYASFPGVQQIVSAQFTLQHGIEPSTGLVECLPQSTPIAEGGDLIFYAGTDQIRIRDCKIGSATPNANANGNIVTLNILDRRWRWEFGAIDGEFNIRDRKNEVIKSSLRECSVLMKYCLDAMDEVGYDVSKVEQDLQPHVEWVQANPAKSLKSLCDEFGYVVVLHLDNHVSIEPLGDGNRLPLGGEESVSTTINPPERPDSFRVVGAPTRFQALIHLEAVGLDIDGTIKPINDLSYAPYADLNGIKWSGVDPEFKSFEKDARRCAKFSVFRWYRIKVSADDDEFKLELPLPPTSGQATGAGVDDFNVTVRVKHINEILPISGDLVQTYTELGRERKKRARVYGTFYTGGAGPGINSNQRVTFSPPNTWQIEDIPDYAPICFQYESQIADFPGVPSNFSINEEFGIVEFPQPVYRKITVTDPATQQPKIRFVAADLWLMCSFNWRNWKEEPAERNYAYHRFKHRVEMPGAQYETGPEIINKEAELQMQIYATYIGTQYVMVPGVGSTITTGIPPGSKKPEWHHLRPRSDLIRAANHYILGAKKKYITTGADDRTYIGLRDIDLDGAVHSVSWAVGPDGVKTRASRNNQPSVFTKRYKFDKFIEGAPQLRSDPRAVVPDLPRPDNLIRQVF